MGASRNATSGPIKFPDNGPDKLSGLEVTGTFEKGAPGPAKFHPEIHNDLLPINLPGEETSNIQLAYHSVYNLFKSQSASYQIILNKFSDQSSDHPWLEFCVPACNSLASHADVLWLIASHTQSSSSQTPGEEHLM